MKKPAIVFLFLIVSGCCAAQGFRPSFDTLSKTPSQMDWMLDDEQSFVADRGASARSSEALVSAERLRHKPPGKAVSAFLRGVKFANAGAWPKALREFRKAVTIDPEFSDAHGNLGAAYSALQCFEDAASEFRRAIELDPKTDVHRSNLAYVLIRLGRETEAELEAKTAVSLNPSNATAHYLLGFLLANHPERSGEAARHLAYAADKIADAHFLLAQLYFSQGATQLGVEELAHYRQEITKQSSAGARIR